MEDTSLRPHISPVLQSLLSSNLEADLQSPSTSSPSVVCQTPSAVQQHSKMVNKAKRSSFRIPKTAWDHSYKIPDFLLTGGWRSVSPSLPLTGDTNFTMLGNISLTWRTFLISINGKWLYCRVVTTLRASEGLSVTLQPRYLQMEGLVNDSKLIDSGKIF